MTGPPDAIADLVGALAERVCVLGLGNRDRGDDAAGPRLIDLLRGRVPFPCWDAGPAPENFLEKVASERPDVVLLVDAADFGGIPGEIRVLDPDELAGTISTHCGSLGLVADYLRARTSARVCLVAVQAVSTRPGQAISPEVAGAVRVLAERLVASRPSPGGRRPVREGAPS
jgi:hydrogenase 3 maturation protease